jgi:CobN/Magnesium Chelatase
MLSSKCRKISISQCTGIKWRNAYAVSNCAMNTHLCKVLSQDTVISRGYDRLQTTLDHACSLTDDCSYRVANPIGLGSAKVVGTSVNPYDLDKYLSKRMTRRVDKQWSVPSKSSSEQVAASATGDYVVSGLQLGNVFIGVQPLLGLEGILYCTTLCYAIVCITMFA